MKKRALSIGILLRALLIPEKGNSALTQTRPLSGTLNATQTSHVLLTWLNQTAFNNPDGAFFVDFGLGGVLNKPSEYGKFKVPSLRNIAKTAPYLHNGIFKNLRQVVVFYNTRDVGPWPHPEVHLNVNHEELGNLGLSEQEIDDIVVFMLTLTDGYKSNEGGSD